MWEKQLTSRETRKTESWGGAPVLERLPSKHKSLSSNPSTQAKTNQPNKKKPVIAGHRWLMPVIPATEEARLGGLQFKVSLGK
jgi:hypothetical protein